MKKTLRRTLLLLLCLMLLLASTATCGLAGDSSAPSNQTSVFTFLTQSIGFNNAAACGIMANMEQESGFDPTLVIRDRNGLLSGGLCQWNGSRFSNLIQFCSDNNLNYLSIPGQLSYLQHELQSRDFKHIYNYLLGVPNTAGGAYDAAYYWCYYFEIPSNRTSRSYARASVAADRYWPAYQSYQSVSLDPVTVSSPQEKQALDLGERLTLNWTAVESADQYLVSIAKKTDGSYDWDHAWQKTLSGATTSLTVKLKSFAVGKYAACVVGRHSESGTTGKAANRVKFSVVCKAHDYVLQSAKEPTFKHDGAYVYVCRRCGAAKTVAKTALSVDTFEAQTVRNLKAVKVTDTALTLTWSRFTGAVGYRVYQKMDDGWKKIRTLAGAGQTSLTIASLQPATRCVFAVRAFAKTKSDTVFTRSAALALYTRPQTTALRSVKANGSGRILVKWVQVPGVNGYTVYVSTEPNDGFYAAADVAADRAAVNIAGLDGGMRYYFFVRPYIVTKGDSKIHAAASDVMSCTAG